ncbi:hypothetical protein RUND412_003426 [Rhizina undulata]
MSYHPPPPGTSSNPSLPPRPPPSMRPFQPAAPAPAFGFRPRQVAAPAPIVAPQAQQMYPQTAMHTGYNNGGYGVPVQQQQYPHHQYAPQTSYASAPTISAAPHIVNPFPLPNQQSYGAGTGAGGGRRGGTGGSADPRFADLDPELQAQIAQQQSIYDPNNAENLKRVSQKAATAATSDASTPGEASGSGAVNGKQPTVIRSGGGQTWADPSLLEWDPSHFRLFVGNLAGEVTDDSLLKAFSKYPSVTKARVIRDKRTTKSKGYGFVAFSDGDEYFRAAKEMNGKYIGSHPVLLRRSTTEIRATVMGGDKKGAGGKGAKTGAGVKKKKGKGKKPDERRVLG